MIRSATPTDAAAIQAIYAPFVQHTAISFEEHPPSVADMEQRIAYALREQQFIVHEEGGAIQGYAYSSPHRTRPAYRTSIDVSVYLAPAAHRQGIGRALYTKLLHGAVRQGYHAAFAGIALPNHASVGLHEAMGFTLVGVYRQVGQKFGRWHDVGWWQRLL
ncbi:arsinothricin resistance N-acetyltransferase ArsN1 family B [Sphingomonas aquatilis]